MSDEGADETCDQTPRSSGQVSYSVKSIQALYTNRKRVTFTDIQQLETLYHATSRHQNNGKHCVAMTSTHDEFAHKSLEKSNI